MANKKHIEIVQLGTLNWNTWRKNNPEIIPDLENAKLDLLQCQGANFENANLRGASLSDANLNLCCFKNANLSNASLIGAFLMKCDFRYANLTNADLTASYLRLSNVKGANMKDVKFTQKDQGGIPMGSFLDLGTNFYLDEAFFSDNNFLVNYLYEAFHIAESKKLVHADIWPEYVYGAKKLIGKYLDILFDKKPNSEINLLTQELSEELIKYLAKHPKALYHIKPRQFEELVGEVLSSFGWEVVLTPSTRDGGYDLFAISKDEAGFKTSWIIECKKYYKDRRIGLDVVRSLYGTKIELKVANMMIATTSYFSKDIVSYQASRYDLELKDFNDIIEWLKDYKPLVSE